MTASARSCASHDYCPTAPRGSSQWKCGTAHPFLLARLGRVERRFLHGRRWCRFWDEYEGHENLIRHSGLERGGVGPDHAARWDERLRHLFAGKGHANIGKFQGCNAVFWSRNAARRADPDLSDDDFVVAARDGRLAGTDRRLTGHQKWREQFNSALIDRPAVVADPN